ncbi:sensor domain-containing diguanylate cyclase [Sporosarcina siberiensis]|uniref:Sensor domain-containing diguanylate cyclase n=1 Tax=Sporosarcina siberiensis TaxID=1365606 RepID=A0ABW4SED4_9BACL
MIKSKEITILSFIWLLIFPAGIYIAYNYFPSAPLELVNIGLLFLLLFFTMLLPLEIQKVTITLEKLIAFVVFFQYGLFTEILFTQFATLILLFSRGALSPVFERFFFNSIMFMITSFGSAFVFHLIGGSIGMTDFSKLFIVGIVYVCVHALLNNLIIKVFFHLKGMNYSLLSKGAIWDYIVTVVIFPLSLALYFLYLNLQNKSIILIGIPLIVILFVIRIYTTSNKLSEQLSHAAVIGHELANHLGFDEVLETFLEKLQDVVPYENGFIVDVRKGSQLLTLKSMESGIYNNKNNGIVFHSNLTDIDGIKKDEICTYHNARELKAIRNIQFLNHTESVLIAPIIHRHKTEGFLILTSPEKNRFNKVVHKIVDILTGYLAISLVKARFFEKTIEKSERCGLTKLYNYRYLEKKLDEEIIRFHTKDISSLSVLIMDIDHFKGINDTYGHESGNDLLCDLSSVLQNFVGPEDTLARYGGEEFVLVLSNANKEFAAKTAEEIRKEVERTVFTVIPDLSIDRTPIEVKMTISIGVSSIPDDSESIKDLMRNADRALYIGGKQAGRNKVGVFGKEYVVTL